VQVKEITSMATPVAPVVDDDPAKAEVLSNSGDTGASDDDAGEGGAEPTGDKSTADEAGGTDDDDNDDEGLSLSAEDLAAIKADPRLKALYKNLHKGFTSKSQKLAAGDRLLRAFQSDPAGTVKALAGRAGVKLADEPPKADVRAAIQTELTSAVGEDLAGQLLPVFEKIASKIAESQIAPLRAELDQQMARSVEEQSALVQETFLQKYPDAKKFEREMMEVAQTIRPVPGTNAVSYLETLYLLATRQKKSGGEAARAVDKMVKAASAGERPGGTPGNRVAATPPDMSKMTKSQKLRAALDAAKRGERWE
jgi:hypothetical protein